MATELVNIKFHDAEADTTSYGTCPVQALEHWKKSGFQECTAEEAAAAARGDANTGPSAEHLEQGLILDDPADPDAAGKAALVAQEGAEQKAAEEAAAAAANQTSDDPSVVKDPTAGDDADSKDDTKPARGGRRSS